MRRCGFSIKWVGHAMVFDAERGRYKLCPEKQGATVNGGSGKRKTES